MNFICDKCQSSKTLPTLFWETIEDPQISGLECLACGHKWTPPRLIRAQTKALPQVLSRKEEKLIDKKTYHRDK